MEQGLAFSINDDYLSVPFPTSTMFLHLPSLTGKVATSLVYISVSFQSIFAFADLNYR
jgi:hypothetical protein